MFEMAMNILWLAHKKIKEAGRKMRSSRAASPAQLLLVCTLCLRAEGKPPVFCH